VTEKWKPTELEDMTGADELAIVLMRPYRTKFARYASTSVEPMVGPVATAAMLRLVPRPDHERRDGK
jgi:hypothetical protein